MFSPIRSFKSSAIFAIVFLAFCSASGPVLHGQDTIAPAVAKPALPATTESANAAQPASPDVRTPRVADVSPDTFIIGTEDVLTINVWKEPEVSKVVPVRPDGMISLPLVGEIKATGLTPIQLQEQIANSLKKVMADPQVTVIVSEVRSLTFNIVGQIQKPGYYPLTRRMTVLDAIALSGGFRDFAKEKKIYVLRTSADGKQMRLRFNYKDVLKRKHPAQNVEMQPRDTLVVP
jgi:polysaccharide export outer membrane protein